MHLMEVTTLNYEYKFVKIEAKQRAFKDVSPAEDYREIIDDHSREGWRLVQIFAPSTRGYGWAGYFELIFERPV